MDVDHYMRRNGVLMFQTWYPGEGPPEWLVDMQKEYEGRMRPGMDEKYKDMIGGGSSQSTVREVLDVNIIEVYMQRTC